jgi:hypothetical protein
MWDIRNIYRLLPVEPKTFKKNEKIQTRIQRRAGFYVKLFSSSFEQFNDSAFFPLLEFAKIDSSFCQCCICLYMQKPLGYMI